MAEEPLPTARDWMETAGFTFRPTEDLLGAIEQLSRRRLAAAPVVGEGGKLLGMLTEKDCLRLLSLLTFHHPRSGRVADFMSSVPEPLRPEMDVFDVVETFLANNFPILPVVEGAKVVGVISRQRMLRGIFELLAEVNEELRPEADVARGVTERPRSIQQMQSLYARLSGDQLARVVGRRR